jgi:hypothetical protein
MLPLVVVAAVFQTQNPILPTLKVEGKTINVGIEGKSYAFDSEADPTTEAVVPHIAYRRDQRWAVWDDRGLTVRDGKVAVTTKLEDISVSPRAFSRDEILKSLEMFKVGKRKKNSDSLSGAIRLGSKCYFLPRWTDTDGKAWLEALIEVDLNQANPRPKFLGRFKGFTSALKPIDDRLFLVRNRLSIVSSESGTWGLASYLDNSGAFEFSPLGTNLISYFRGGYFLESTTYNTYIVGQIDLGSGLRKNLFETRSKLVDLKDGSSVAVIRQKGSTIVKNLKTGGQITTDGNAYVAPVDKYVLVWTKEKRTSAYLYEPVRWTAVATATN